MFFSIVIPVYNRERWITRCLDSVASQDFRDIEIIVVDDGSSDRSVERVLAHPDPRIRLIRHPVNRGMCPTRNTGIAAATGQWVMALDSDDEFVPGALSVIHGYAASAPDNIDAYSFRVRLDDGSLNPAEMPEVREWDFFGYLAYHEAMYGLPRDMIRCVRRRCYDKLMYPDSRMLEDKYLLDFARLFRTRICEDVVRLYHQDADNQIVKHVRKLDPVRDAEFIRDRVEGFRALLDEYGPILIERAPRQYGAYLQQAAMNSMMCRKRREAIGYAFRLVRHSPGVLRSWLVLISTFLGPGLVQSLKGMLSFVRSKY